ncbi:MAG: nucleotide exchange factor GrpE [Clostridiales bacterium]|nr:nucleotide exchange factor GrpE [Clostridiales bacterium]
MAEEKINEKAEQKESPVEKKEKTEKKDNKDKEKKALKLLEKQLEELTKEKEELNDTYIRMLAEYDNFRKRVQKEKESIYSDGVAEAVEKLLPVLDNLERALATDKESTDVKGVLEGVKKILDQANEAFAKLGVSEIPSLGEKFNPEYHNAVMHEESEDYEENTVSDVFLKGYKIGDKVIRHSVVKVMN